MRAEDPSAAVEVAEFAAIWCFVLLQSKLYASQQMPKKVLHFTETNTQHVMCVQLGVQHTRNTTGAVQLMVMYFLIHGCNLV